MQLKEELVELIYDVALGESSWEKVVKELKKEFNARLAFMLIMRPKQTPVIISTISNDNPLWKSYGEYFNNIDPWNEILTSGKIAISTCYTKQIYDYYMKDQDYFNTEYFNDFWKPRSQCHIGGGLFMTNNNILIVLGFPKEKAGDSYEAYESQMMTFYGRQITRAIELEGMFGISLPKKIYAQALGTSYGLSVAESKLVLELYKCGSLPEASKSLNRSYHTIRNQMKSIFHKTDTTNQLELFKLLVTSQK